MTPNAIVITVTCVAFLQYFIINQDDANQHNCSQNTKFIADYKTQINYLKYIINRSVQHRQIGIYKWNIRPSHVFSWTYRNLWITMFYNYSKYTIYSNQYVYNYKHFANTTCYVFNTVQHLMLINITLNYLQNFQLYNTCYKLQIINSTTYMLKHNIDRHIMFKYLNCATRSISHLWKACSITNRKCATTYTATEIEIGKILYWLTNDKQLIYMNMDEQRVLSRFIQLITVGRVDWSLGNKYVSYFPIEIQQNVTIFKENTLDKIQSIFELYNVSGDHIPNILNNIYRQIQVFMERDILASYSNHLSAKFVQTNIHHASMYVVSTFGLIGNIIIIIMYRLNFTTTNSYNKTFVALLAVLDSLCVAIPLMIHLLSHFSSVSFCIANRVIILLTLVSNWTLAYLCALRALCLLFPFYFKMKFTFTKALKYYIVSEFIPFTFYLFYTISFYVLVSIDLFNCSFAFSTMCGCDS